MTKKIGFIGLGKMGAPIAQRLVRAGRSLYVYDRDKNKDVKGAVGCRSVREIADKLARPRVIILCVPVGKTVDKIIRQLGPSLAEGDTLIDLGNSFYRDSQRRAKKMERRGVCLIDVGLSGGTVGARHGACLMVGGNADRVSRLKNLFEIMSDKGSYKYLGRSGAGHFVKGFHNLIEYGYLQALAEGLESCYKLSKKEGLKVDLKSICDIWDKGSIIESRLVLDAKKAFQKYRTLGEINGSVYGQTLAEMKKLIKLASGAGVRVYVGKAAVAARLDSQKRPTYSGRIINAVRNIFGGHEEWKKR